MKKVLAILFILTSLSFAQTGKLTSAFVANSATVSTSAFVVHDSANVSIQAVDSLCAAVWLLESNDGVTYITQSAKIDSIKFAGGGVMGYSLAKYLHQGSHYVIVKLVAYSTGNSATLTDLTSVWVKDYAKSATNY